MPKCLGRGRGQVGWAGRTVLKAIHTSKEEWIVAGGNTLQSEHLIAEAALASTE